MNSASLLVSVTQLGYIGLEVKDIAAWRDFATDFLGMQVNADGDGALCMRMDERQQRMFATYGEVDRLSCIGLEVRDLPSLESAAKKLVKSSFEVHCGTPDECKTRGVSSMRWCLDPDGNRVELYAGPVSSETPFCPQIGVGGFRTGDLGLGHVVLLTPQIEVMTDFYGALGFRLSDYMDAPFVARFFHTNPRHHSLALLTAPQAKIHHVMIEYLHLDDIGRMYDKALVEPDRIVSTLGRHSNDHMLSFYSKTPSGFMIETGWAGRLIDVDTWKHEQVFTPSLWGHDRKWLPDETRRLIRSEMDKLAASGVRAPVEVNDTAAFNFNIPRHSNKP